MRFKRHWPDRPLISLSSAREESRGRAGRRRCSAFAVALGLALAVLMLNDAPAVAQPTLSPGTEVNAPPGTLVSFHADVFGNAGTNPRFTDAVFSTMEYYDPTHTGIRSHNTFSLFVQVKTAEELNALASPPPSSFTVTVDVTMTNDEGQTGTGTVTFRTGYVRVPTAGTPPETSSAPPVQPTVKPEAVTIPVGTLTSITAGEVFDNAGTNPRFTDAVFADSPYLTDGRVHNGLLFVEAKTAEQLNALSPPPPSPFTVAVDVTMTNDEDQTATGTLTYEMRYARATTAGTPPEAPRDPPVQPTFSRTATESLPVGILISYTADEMFDNAGTNPRFTGAVFPDRTYLNEGAVPTSGTRAGQLFIEVKTAEQLSALASPPDSPFTVTAEVTMTNDEGQTATGTVTFEMRYARTTTAGTTPEPPSEPPVPPTFSQTNAITAHPGAQIVVQAVDVFDNAGTNPRFTSAHFSSAAAYYELAGMSFPHGRLVVQAKTAEELRALASPPPESFTVTADVTMTNDEGQTATGTLTFETSYSRAATAGTTPEPPDDPPVQPTLPQLSAVNAPPGMTVSVAVDLFDNPGTNPRFTEAVFSTMEYYDPTSTGLSIHPTDYRLFVRAKTAEELNALASPPPETFTVTADVTMTNDEGQTATGTLTFQTVYVRAPTAGTTPEAPSEPPVQPTLPQLSAVNAPPGITVSVDVDLFDNPGTNPRFTDAVFSTMEYYDPTWTGLSIHPTDYRLFVRAKTAEELNALASPPPETFTVTADVTMTNDEGQTATGTLTFQTVYLRAPTAGTTQEAPSEPPVQPTFSRTAVESLPVGTLISYTADEMFDNAGTNPRFTGAVFPDRTYLNEGAVPTSGTVAGRLFIEVKTAEQLSALSPPPPSPFTVTAEVTMTNDEGQTASGTITFEMTYDIQGG